MMDYTSRLILKLYDKFKKNVPQIIECSSLYLNQLVKKYFQGMPQGPGPNCCTRYVYTDSMSFGSYARDKTKDIQDCSCVDCQHDLQGETSPAKAGKWDKVNEVVSSSPTHESNNPLFEQGKQAYK